MSMQLINACKAVLAYASISPLGIPGIGKRGNTQKIFVYTNIHLLVFYELHLPSHKIWSQFSVFFKTLR